jgi:hypothetical protein
MKNFRLVWQASVFVLGILCLTRTAAAVEQSHLATDFNGDYELSCTDAAYEIGFHIYSSGEGGIEEVYESTLAVPLNCGPDGESTMELESNLNLLESRCLEAGIMASPCADVKELIRNGVDALGYTIPYGVTISVDTDSEFMNRYMGLYLADAIYHRVGLDTLSTKVLMTNADGADHGKFIQGVAAPLPTFLFFPVCLPGVLAYAEGQIYRDADFALEGSFRGELGALCPMGNGGDVDRDYFARIRLTLAGDVFGTKLPEGETLPVCEDTTTMTTEPGVPAAPAAPAVPDSVPEVPAIAAATGADSAE